MKGLFHFFIYLLCFLGFTNEAAGQSIDLQLGSRKVCSRQVAVDLFVKAAEFSTDTFMLGNSSIFINFDPSKIRFNQYLPDAFDPGLSQQATDAGWTDQQHDYDNDFGIFHLVLQKADTGTNNYKFFQEADSIRIGTLLFDFLEEGGVHDLSVNFPYTHFGEGMNNDGSQQIQLANVPMISLFNEAGIWAENFSDLADSLKAYDGLPAWSVDETATNDSAANYYVGTYSGQFRFGSTEGEAVWQSQWIDLCGEGVALFIDLRESGTLEEDDYIRAFYQLDDGPEVLIGEIVDDAEQNNTYYTFSTNEAVLGNQIRLIVRAKNGINGDFERHEFDNIQFNTVDCSQSVSAQTKQVTHNSAEIFWNPDFGADTYKILYRVKGETTWDPDLSNQVFEATATSSAHTITNLTNNTEYEYRVQSVCDTSLAPMSVLASFKTDICTNIANSLIGRPCNDNNPETVNDVYTTDCVCAGSFVVPLAVELLYFNAEPREKVVSLNWKTASEKNNAYFIIERSANGANWEELVQIPGAGDSYEPLSYEAVDSLPLPGHSFYRLASVEYDGATAYSKVVSAYIDQGIDLNRLVIYPNPARDQVTLSQPLEGIFSITDVYGNRVRQGILDDAVIDLSTLPGGVYFVEIETDAGVVVRRVVKE